MLQKYNRVLPSNELLYDRYDKASLVKAGEGSNIYDSSVIMGDVIIGKNVWIGPFCVIEAINDCVEIGDYCNISSGVHIYSHDSVHAVLTSGKAPFRSGKVSIGHNTYVGSQSIISWGVKIGSYCVVGANTFVNESFADYSVIVGSPGKKVGEIVIADEEVKLVYY